MRFIAATLSVLAMAAFAACIPYLWLGAGTATGGSGAESWREQWVVIVFWLLVAVAVAGGGLWGALHRHRYLVTLAAAIEVLLALIVVTGDLGFWPFVIGTVLMVSAGVAAGPGLTRDHGIRPEGRWNRAFVLVLGATVLALVLLAWGPLLVTSPDEALESARDATAFVDLTVGEVVGAYETTTGEQGVWRVETNQGYDSFFEGDQGGFRWIVTYDASGTDDHPELEFWVKRFTGGIMMAEPNWSFLPDDQLADYLARSVE